jgi:hypothetical protein
VQCGWSGNTPHTSEGYYHRQPCDTMAHNLFVDDSKTTSEASTPTRRGDAFVTRLTKNRRFGSSGLNLASEGLLLGVSHRLRAKGTYSDPRKFRLFVHDAFVHPKGAFVTFCREVQMPKAPKWKRPSNGSEAHCWRPRGEGPRTNVYTWRHLIGVSKSDSVM